MLYVGIATGSLLAGELLPIPDFVGIAIGAELLVVLAIAALRLGDSMIARSNRAASEA